MTWHQESETFRGFFGMLADPLVTRIYAKDVRSNLEKLTELLDLDSSTTCATTCFTAEGSFRSEKDAPFTHAIILCGPIEKLDRPLEGRSIPRSWHLRQSRRPPSNICAATLLG